MSLPAGKCQSCAAHPFPQHPSSKRLPNGSKDAMHNCRSRHALSGKACRGDVPPRWGNETQCILTVGPKEELSHLDPAGSRSSLHPGVLLYEPMLLTTPPGLWIQNQLKPAASAMLTPHLLSSPVRLSHLEDPQPLTT